MTDDIPSGIDLQDEHAAHTWVAEADAKRPWRAEIRDVFAALVGGNVLELGAGPGLLAERILREGRVDAYTVFDFSEPMLAMCRERLGDRVRYVLGDFKREAWTSGLGRFDAVVAMQAVHEIRHKQHVPRLYREVRAITEVLVICDHEPMGRQPGLHSTEAEQHAGMHGAGFDDVRTEWAQHGMYVVSGRAAGVIATPWGVSG